MKYTSEIEGNKNKARYLSSCRAGERERTHNVKRQTFDFNFERIFGTKMFYNFAEIGTCSEAEQNNRQAISEPK